MMHTPALPATDRDKDAVVQRAIRAARAAAEDSGTQIREIGKLSELQDASRLLSGVWDRDLTSPQMTVDLLRALSATGNYVTGSFLNARLIGVGVAFFASPPPTSLHSHITGVAVANQARNVGYALKLHQRAWALHRGVSTITWTFDPLVRRNAYFNLTKLGARAVEYLPNFYGEMQDRLNAGDQSDRLLVEWSLLAPSVVSICDTGGTTPSWDGVVERTLNMAVDGTPCTRSWGGARAMLTVPPDIERLRISAPALAHQWRLALRDALGGAFADGARVIGFRRTEGYVIDPSPGPT